jgi:helicase MOV-10
VVGPTVRVSLSDLVTAYIFVHKYLCSVEIENDDEDLLPEVTVGDFVWLDDQKNLRFEARVTDINVHMRHHLAVMKLSLRLPTDLNHYYTGPNVQFVVRVRHNRITIRRQYHALTKSFPPPRRLLFPSVLDIKSNRHLSKAEIYNLNYCHLVNRCIRDDPQQLQAVVSILEQPKGSIPFIIYGP